MKQADFSNNSIIWDEEHIKTLLFEPENFVSEEPWNSWVKKQGGLGNVRKSLRELPLSEKHRKTLSVILSEPGASLQRYALLLHASVATFVRHRNSLIKTLTALLNSNAGKVSAGHSAEKDKTASQHPNNLPLRAIPLIGRQNELNTIQNILLQESVGLLTITGPGGIGKTRLALQTAIDLLPQFEDGVFFIPLASISNPNLVASIIVKTLGLPGADNFPAHELLKSHLQDKRLLLVLDNFEQIIPAASLVDELLKAAPYLKILVTSRAVLHVYGEYEFNVSPLQLPNLHELPELNELSESPAVALFIERARAAKNSFVLTAQNAAVVAEICIRLDGIPLALELAAARCKLFSPQALLRELKQRFSLLEYKSIDREPRHQTLRNAIDWSFQLLNDEERNLFIQMGIFVGGCTLEAINAVCITEQTTDNSITERLFSLVDKSMLQNEIRPNGEPRFTMLESLCEYALEQLEQVGQISIIAQRHLAYYLHLVEAIEPGPSDPNLPAWMNLLEEEHNNLRIALQRALDYREYESALRISGAIWRFWQIHGHIDEGAKWLQEILEHVREQENIHRAKVLWGAGWLAMVRGYLEQARAYFEEGEQLSRQLGNMRYLGLSLHGIGAVARAQGNFSRSRESFAESLPLFQTLGNAEDVAWTLEHLGATALDQGEFEQAASYLEQGLAIFRRLNQQWPCAEALTFLGHASLQQTDYTLARKYYQQARAVYQELDDYPNVATLNLCIGMSLHRQGEHKQAVSFYKENLALLHELKSYWGLVWGIECVAEFARHSGQNEAAARLYGAASSLRQMTGVLWHPGFHSQYNQGRFDSLKNALGLTIWEQYLAEGRAMKVDKAISYALEIVEN